MVNKGVQLLASAVILCSGGWGQSLDLDCLKGEVHTDSRTISRTAVTLSDLQNHRAFGPVDLASDGTFEFYHVPYGQYHLTVLQDGDHQVYDSLVSVREQTSSRIVVNVPRQEVQRPPAALFQFSNCCIRQPRRL